MTELGKLRASNWWVTVSTGGENFNLLENLLQKVTLWGVWLIMLFDEYSANSTWLVTSRHVRRVESMRFGCVELVKQHGLTRSTRSSRLARQSGMCRVVSRRAKWNLAHPCYLRWQTAKTLFLITCRSVGWNVLIATSVVMFRREAVEHSREFSWRDKTVRLWSQWSADRLNGKLFRRNALVHVGSFSFHCKHYVPLLPMMSSLSLCGSHQLAA